VDNRTLADSDARLEPASAGQPPLQDLREKHFRIPGVRDNLRLFLRYLPPADESGKAIVLYVHGATFPSALSIAHRFDGRSWRDELCAAGFHVWGLDFQGFGGSDRYPEMSAPADNIPALGRAQEASQQVELAVRFIVDFHKVKTISLITHSWGSIAAGHFAGRCPDLVDRIVFFAPISMRTVGPSSTSSAQDEKNPVPPGGWRLVTLEAQWDRFTEDVPSGHSSVLAPRHFAEWGELYLDTDAESRLRVPPSVKVPSGPSQDIANAWQGDLPYDPGRIKAPVAIIRGEWDETTNAADTAWLFSALSSSPMKREIKISCGTHLMHLEQSRYALYRETEIFLSGKYEPGAEPQGSSGSARLIASEP
jgi:pimeloyl-ACP methyl ester carboxylesterase